MANTKTAKQNIRLTERRTDINRARVSRIRTFVKKVETAILSGNAELAKNALIAAQPELHRGASKGVLHKNTVARKISRLSQRIKTLSA
ncbi:MAG: 30S ribosomal protein S20 [Alphaproteobacteria bacterium]|jgi:small subunit ribosomal protein S20|nr:30S ribosomal protein S20 [Alphaproteobacteria bacterium]MDP3531991.1 30S ribosomal protein S20 [Alphaproteobacteria bacterium]